MQPFIGHSKWRVQITYIELICVVSTWTARGISELVLARMTFLNGIREFISQRWNGSDFRVLGLGVFRNYVAPAPSSYVDFQVLGAPLAMTNNVGCSLRLTKKSGLNLSVVTNILCGGHKKGGKEKAGTKIEGGGWLCFHLFAHAIAALVRLPWCERLVHRLRELILAPKNWGVEDAGSRNLVALCFAELSGL